ncbi:MAG TPA: hypothetical protein VKU62_00700 [Thermoanaerobaculia bacterium]|nr:hypothetical protein [Thermoanaerobaculia bacterium]
MRKSILIVAAVAIACNKNAAPPTTASQTPDTAPPAAAQPAPPAPAPATATTASVAPATGAIASTDGEKPGMHIDVTELKRASGGTVNLKFVLTNATSEKPSFWEFLHEKDTSNDSYDVSGVHLVDPVNKKKYFVVVDTEKKCLCSGKLEHMDPNSKMNLWAKFPAPPPDVQKVTIEIPHFQPMDDVPIAQ